VGVGARDVASSNLQGRLHSKPHSSVIVVDAYMSLCLAWLTDGHDRILSHVNDNICGLDPASFLLWDKTGSHLRLA
jgi:hypothetical protein